MIGAVVAFTNRFARGACGQTVGADGTGTFAVLFEANSVEAAVEAARAYANDITTRGRAQGVILATAEETFIGPHLQVRQVEQPLPETEVAFEYTNWRGETHVRRVIPIRVWYGQSSFHPETQWFLHGLDVDKQEPRDFALKDVRDWRAA